MKCPGILDSKMIWVKVEEMKKKLLQKVQYSSKVNTYWIEGKNIFYLERFINTSEIQAVKMLTAYCRCGGNIHVWRGKQAAFFFNEVKCNSLPIF